MQYYLIKTIFFLMVLALCCLLTFYGCCVLDFLLGVMLPTDLQLTQNRSGKNRPRAYLKCVSHLCCWRDAAVPPAVESVRLTGMDFVCSQACFCSQSTCGGIQTQQPSVIEGDAVLLQSDFTGRSW